MNLGNGNSIRVMVLSNSLNSGGAERFASTLLSELPSAGMAPRLVLLRSDRAYPLSDTIPVHVLDYHAPWDIARTVARLRRIMGRVQPHVLLGVGTSVNVVAGLALIAMRQPPGWIARVDTNLQRGDLRLRRILLRQLHRRARCIVTNSLAMGRALASDCPGLQSKITTLYNPVAFHQLEAMSRGVPTWQPRKHAPLLVTAGRAHGAKRWDMLLQAFAQVLQTHAAQLAFCGAGPLLEELKGQASRLNVAHAVHFLGHCDNPFAILAQADLFVLSSEAEGLPNALIEAQGMGICAVAARCAFGPEEIVAHGVTGLLTPVNDSAAMARAIVTLLDDDQRRRRMGTKAKEMVRRQFDHRRRCGQWEALIRQVAGGAARDRSES